MTLSKSLLVVSFLLVVPLAIILHKAMYSGWTPPSDYGSGEMFNLIAERYDFVNRVMSLGMDIQWRERMVQTVHASLKTTSLPNPRILDVSTGTADVALLLAKEMPEATILGIDPSNKMLDFGREKIADQNLSERIVLEQHDARDLSNVQDNAFDAATMAFGIRNVPEKAQALCEIHRLLKNGSRFCILEFAEPDESAGVLGAIARLFIRHVIPFVGGILVSNTCIALPWHVQKKISTCSTILFLFAFP
jgi:demethylmenaquinone methyltransferase/2-methoxy-6-polyprenyl-1,4-benzoquinol methylase